MTTNVPQDVIDYTLVRDVAKMYGLDYNKLSAAYRELLRAQRQQGGEPVAYVIWGIGVTGEHYKADVKLLNSDWQIDDGHLGDRWAGNEPVYTTPPQANALVAAFAKGLSDEWMQRVKAIGRDCGSYRQCSDEILAAIPADAEGALRERDRAVCQRLLKVVEEHYELIAPLDIDGSIVNSVLGEGGK
jgi:hypothetical protein